MSTPRMTEAQFDDISVDRFADAMKAKLSKSRDKGRGGWHDTDLCSDEFLADLLIGHLEKRNQGTFEDIANFAMMLFARSADPGVLADANKNSALHVRHLERRITQMNLLLLGVLAEHEQTGRAVSTVEDIRKYYDDMKQA